MSDVALAPAPSAPASAPAAEVPITPGVDRPAPIDSQGPQKPQGRAETVRETLERSFAKAGDTNAKPPTRHGMGHNNPPEPMAKEQQKFDLKKPPPKDGEGEGRARAEHGHFAPREDRAGQAATASNGQATASNAANGQQAPGGQHVNPLPDYAPYREPPPRMADHAKAEWHKAPESVRGEVARMHKEMSDAYTRFRGDHETMNTIRPFEQMAREHGTTLQRAMTNYTTMERKLVSDPYGAFDMIVSNLNLRTPDGQKLTFRDLAYDYLQQSPEQHRLTQAQNAQSAQSYQLGAINQKVEAIANGFQQLQYQEAHRQLRTGVDQYADQRPRFDELAPLIEREVYLGFDLDTAYRRAELLAPATHAAQTRQTNPSAQTRTLDKSISGAPSSGLSDRRSPGNGKVPSTREALANAHRAAFGGRA